MTITIKPNTLPFPGCKIYPDYEYRNILTEDLNISQIRSFIPISRNGDSYLIEFTSSIESINTTNEECNWIIKPTLIEDLEFHAKQMQEKCIIPSKESLITIYKYE